MAAPKVVLISTYELGRQPFGLASPAAWLRRAGAVVTCLDLAVQRLDEETIRAADLVAFYVPMHTATRLASALVPRVKALNPRAHLSFYGLYAPVNEGYLRSLGAETILGGEFEAGLVSLLARLPGGANRDGQPQPVISLARQKFLVPDRGDLVSLSRYASLILNGEKRIVGSTEASRGCKHLCRHCPVVPVYGGQFRIVQREVVLEDIRRQVAAGAEHITFGDPDFFNGIGHSLAIVRALHDESPHITYDVTIKIEHLVKHAAHLAALRDTGCLFVTSAVESLDDRILARLEKGHTRRDFEEVVRLFRELGLTLAPTFVPFTPWISLEGYLELLAALAEMDLVEHVAPIQLAIRLLIPAGSRLLELQEMRDLALGFDDALLSYRWRHPDQRVDRLQAGLQELVRQEEAAGAGRREVFGKVWLLAEHAAGKPCRPLVEKPLGPARTPIPFMTEPWFC
jgi:radical SAM superfamily enzyme YgiQ (UPF0313 family)